MLGVSAEYIVGDFLPDARIAAVVALEKGVIQSWDLPCDPQDPNFYHIKCTYCVGDDPNICKGLNVEVLLLLSRQHSKLTCLWLV